MENYSLVDDIKKFGLNEYEAKAYLALALNGPLTASLISEKSRIPQSKVYEILRSLKLKSLTQTWPSKPCRYKAVDPTIALKSMIDEKKSNLAELDQKIKIIMEKMKPREIKNTSEMWIVKGRKFFLRALSNAISKCHNLVCLTTEDFPKRSFLDYALLEAKRNGAAVRILGTKLPTKYAEIRKIWYENSGAEVSITNAENVDIGIFDENEGYIRINENEFMWISNSFLVNILNYYFNMLWNSSKNLQ